MNSWTRLHTSIRTRGSVWQQLGKFPHSKREALKVMHDKESANRSNIIAPPNYRYLHRKEHKITLKILIVEIVEIVEVLHQHCRTGRTTMMAIRLFFQTDTFDFEWWQESSSTLLAATFVDSDGNTNVLYIYEIIQGLLIQKLSS